MRRERMAWAIDTRSDEGHGFLGVWFITPGLNVSPSQMGNTTALFKTRAEAREWVRQEKRKAYQAFPKMAVVRVKVTIEATP